MINLDDIEDIEPMEGEKPNIELPFSDKRGDVVDWVYVHYVGIITVMSLYIIVMVVLITVKIVVSPRRDVSNVVEIDLEQVEALREERDRLQEEVEQKQEEVETEPVQNQISNEASQETERVDFDAMMEEAAEQQRIMAENRAAYERGLAEAEELISNPPAPKPFLESYKPRRDIKVAGKVTVSYTLDNPVRHANEIIVPSYLCEGGGEVSIRIGVNPKGEVELAKVIRGGDECMQQAALNSALASRFEANRAAPYRHMGIIIYTFVPQGGVRVSTQLEE